MRNCGRPVLLAAGLVLWGCDRLVGPETSSTPQFSAGAMVQSATGGGEYLLGGTLPTNMSFSAIATPDGRANGQFRHHTEEEGFIYDFHGEVTCMAVDAVNHRAWIAGVITKNGSTDPAFQQAIHQVGRDIWFRVLDGGEGNDAAGDRMTFVGFEGSAGVTTSPEYCQRRLWGNNGQPVIRGNIQVRP